jgi:DNA polymerase III epsilon subunit-like protein
VENQQKNGTYLIIDLEMTGLNPFQHGVIEVGAIVLDYRFEIIGEFFMDLCPPDNIIIDPKALEYNGFTLDRIAA